MNYMSYMQRAIDYINANVSSELNLDEIVRQTYISKSYFCKLFRFITGYTIKGYVIAYRLNLASQDLLTTEKKIIDIAFDCGFQSQQTFTKAFVSAYGIPPGRCRKTKMILTPLQNPNIFYKGDRIMDSIFNNVRFVEKEAFNVIGIEVKLDYNNNGHNRIKDLWDKWVNEKIYDKIPNPVNYPVTMGMTEDTKKEDTAVYRICMEVWSLDIIPKGLTGKVMPKTSYAVFRLPLEKIGEFWQYFYKKWLPESGYEQPGTLLTQGGWQVTNKAQIEAYSNSTVDKIDEIEIYAPIIMK